MYTFCLIHPGPVLQYTTNYWPGAPAHEHLNRWWNGKLTQTKSSNTAGGTGDDGFVLKSGKVDCSHTRVLGIAVF